MSVNSHHNGQKFTNKSLENVGLSVKCGLLTDKSAKIGSLSVNLSEISVHRPEQEKIRAITGTDLKSSFSCGAWSSKACVRGHDRSLPHLYFILSYAY
ncbi:hypothetical protein GPK26_08710 [Ligilactobacillus ruminis]|nr:hypothetical protein [Ligilactobacillus ruminis]